MKKMMILGILSVCLVLGPCVSHAQTAPTKLGRGIANTLTGVVAIPVTMGRERDKHGIMAGMTTGLIKGIGWFVVRELVGVYEILTFPIPVPEGYRPILDDPEYFF